MKIPDDFGEFERKLRGSKALEGMKMPIGKLVIGGVILLLLVIAGFGSVYQVEPEGEAVVQRFGRVVDVKPPGLHFKLPFGIDQVTFVPTKRTLKEELGFQTVANRSGRTEYRKVPQEALMLTGDLSIVSVEWVVQYEVPDPVKWLFSVRHPERTIRDIAESVMRRIVGNRLSADVLTEARGEISLAARTEMQEILDSYEMGVSIKGVELQDVTPPEQVASAFNEVNEARQEKERLVNEAEKQRNQVIPRARGEAAQIISEAEAYGTERVNRAKGEADRFKSIFAEYEKAPGVTRQRLYLEMIDELMPAIANLYVIDESGTSPLPLLDLGSTLSNRGGDR